ncbi:hypothetical protein SAMN04487764_1818 [Gillisia sp. Hel1_33_143]|uniref:hypothetical protein n=1 Tax=unclassified Gillisia TaxID=2615025 RepID=UPI0005585282|nr:MULTISPECIES: hypothetical protein [unclassified Gillisia]SDS26418.1 hypothetical protein SAMN04487764_1818 [Gillisia sp. Hel1_33_143]
MKKVFPFLLITMMACNSQQNIDAQKQAIVNFLQEDAKGVKTDLKIEVSQIEITDVTVADSISILKERYQAEIEKAQKSIDNFQSNIDSAMKENKSLDNSNIDNLANIAANKSIGEMNQRGLEKAQAALKEVDKQKSISLAKYEDRDENELLVKKAETTFSFFNPRLQTRQERTDDFVMSKDGSEVVGIIENGKVRRKRK